jgi:O-antigen/teichoic acid export membrane protein
VYVAVVAYTATFLLGLVALLLANRLVRPTLRRSLHDAWRIRTVRGAKVFDTAWPMLLIMISGALAMQTDRIVLSHRSSVAELAEYSLAAQMFNPLLGVVGTATVALWPIFARARASGVRSDVSPTGVAALFGAAAVVLTLIISLLSGVLSRLATGGAITLGPVVLVAFSLLVVVQAVKYPLGTYMSDAHGLRYQALMILAMLPLNFGLSWVLAAPLGAVGPIIGSLVGVAIFEMFANLAYIRRRHVPDP